MKLYKISRYALFGFLVLLCEQTFGKYIAIGGAVPMLSLCFCVSTAVSEQDDAYVVWVSTVLGALCDILSGHGFGTYTLTYTLSAMGAYSVHNKLFSSKSLFLALSMIVFTIFTQIVYYLFHITEIRSGFGFVSLILPMAVYNAAVVVLMYPLFKKILKRR